MFIPTYLSLYLFILSVNKKLCHPFLSFSVSLYLVDEYKAVFIPTYLSLSLFISSMNNKRVFIPSLPLSPGFVLIHSVFIPSLPLSPGSVLIHSESLLSPDVGSISHWSLSGYPIYTVHTTPLGQVRLGRGGGGAEGGRLHNLPL